uniref:Uncharacterized protein n=1 Tax=Oryza barthii TaxID=65489 RepID=A0A0D3H5C0_9ORYZ
MSSLRLPSVIFSFSSNEDASIQIFVQNDLSDNFFLLLSPQALHQLNELSNILESIVFSSQNTSINLSLWKWWALLVGKYGANGMHSFLTISKYLCTCGK